VVKPKAVRLMPLSDPGQSRVLLAGSSAFTELPSLPAVAQNLRRLRELLTDSDLWGISDAHCRTVAEPAGPEVMLDAVHQAAEEATELLLVYYAGHGLLDPHTDELYLALPGSGRDRMFTAVRYADLRSVLVNTSRAAVKAVILDCCYSGRAMPGGMSGVAQIVDQARIEGTYLMTASAENATALAPVGEQFTAFTGELIKAIGLGIEGGPDPLTMETLYWHVRSELIAKARPVPQQRAANGGGSIALVRNRRGTADRVQPASAVRHDPASPRQIGASRDTLRQRAKARRDQAFIREIADLIIARDRADRLLASAADRVAQGCLEEAAEAYRLVAESFGASSEAMIQERVAKAQVGRGEVLSQLGRKTEAVEVYDEVVGRFRESPEPAVLEQVAAALLNKGANLAGQGFLEEAVAVYAGLVERFARRSEPGIQVLVSKTLVNQGVALGQLGHTAEALSAFEELAGRFGSAADASLQENAIRAMTGKGLLLVQAGRLEEAIVAYSEVAQQSAGAPSVDLRRLAASALRSKAEVLVRLGRFDEAATAYDEVLRWFGEAPETLLREEVARALVGRGLSLQESGRLEEAADTYDEVIRRFGNAPGPVLREEVALALSRREGVLGMLGRPDQVTAVSDKAANHGPATPAASQATGIRLLGEAEHCAQLITDGESRVRVLARIAGELAAADPDHAALLMAQAERTAQSITDDSSKSAALGEIASALAATDPDRAERFVHSDPGAQARTRIAEALAVTDPDRAECLARAIPEDYTKTSAMVGVAAALAATDPGRAARLMANAERFAAHRRDKYTKIISLCCIAKAVAADEPDRAARLVAKAERAVLRMDARDVQTSGALSAIAGAVAISDPRKAELFAIQASITMPVYKMSAEVEIAKAMVATDPAGAEHLARSIQDEFWQVPALAGVAIAINAIDPYRTTLLLAEAERVAISITDPSWKALSLIKVAAAWSRLNDLQQQEVP
jgi:tetratricopeptide (TPR) repeat protein